MDKESSKSIKLPPITRSNTRFTINRRLTSAERKREIEKRLSVSVPKRNDIIGTFTNLDKNLDVIFPLFRLLMTN